MNNDDLKSRILAEIVTLRGVTFAELSRIEGFGGGGRLYRQALFRIRPKTNCFG